MTDHLHPRSDSDLRELGRHAAESLANVRRNSDARLRARARFLSGERRSHRREIGVRPWAVAFAVAVAAAASFFVAGVALSPKAALSVSLERSGWKSRPEAGALVEATEAEAALAFGDGTRVTLRPGSRGRIASIDAHGARLLLERGDLHAEVAPLRGANWIFDAGPFQVRVTGTRFDVSWDPDRQAIVVTLLEGSVSVRGCGLASTGQRVIAGQRLTASCKDSTMVLAAASAPLERALTLDVDHRPHPNATVEGPKPAASAPIIAKPRALEGTSTTSEPAGPSAAELLKRAEDARFAGDVTHAKEALLELRKRFPRTDAAAMAAFELGRIAFDSERDHAAAARWFEMVLGERPEIGFAREALGRALEAKNKAGDRDGAKRHALRYVAVYPDGPHADFARRVLEGTSQETREP